MANVNKAMTIVEAEKASKKIEPKLYIHYRSDGREELHTRTSLTNTLFFINKRKGSRSMTKAQCGAVVGKMELNKIFEFCGSKFEYIGQ